MPEEYCYSFGSARHADLQARYVIGSKMKFSAWTTADEDKRSILHGINKPTPEGSQLMIKNHETPQFQLEKISVKHTHKKLYLFKLTV